MSHRSPIRTIAPSLRSRAGAARRRRALRHRHALLRDGPRGRRRAPQRRRRGAAIGQRAARGERLRSRRSRPRVGARAHQRSVAGSAPIACRAPTPAALSFRERMVRIDVPSGDLAPRTWMDGGTPVPLQAACVRGADGWTCRCPPDGRPALPAPAGSAMAPAFVVELAASTRADVVRVIATGCTRSGAGATCAASVDAAGEATARLEAAWAMLPALRVAAGRGADRAGRRRRRRRLARCPQRRCRERRARHPRRRPHRRRPRFASARRPGASLGASLASGDDAALRALSADRFFARTFGMGPAAWAAQPAARRVDCASDCAGRLGAAIAAGKRLLAIEGDATITGPAAFGSADDPIVARRRAAHCACRATSSCTASFTPPRSNGTTRRRAARSSAAPSSSAATAATAPSICIATRPCLARLAAAQRQLRSRQRQLEGLPMNDGPHRGAQLAGRGASAASAWSNRSSRSSSSPSARPLPAHLQSQLRLAGDVARERSEAIRLGQAASEDMRSFAVLDGAPGQRSFAAIASGDASAAAASSPAAHADYRIERAIDDVAFGAAKSTRVAVRWRDRGGSERDSRAALVHRRQRRRRTPARSRWRPAPFRARRAAPSSARPACR